MFFCFLNHNLFALKVLSWVNEFHHRYFDNKHVSNKIKKQNLIFLVTSKSASEETLGVLTCSDSHSPILGNKLVG